MSLSDKIDTRINILRLKLNNQNMEELSNISIKNWLGLAGVDSVDSKLLEGFHGFDPRGEPIYVRDIPF
jgi:hypothetical protein